MSYEVLARKWRPQVFQDVIGQEHITQTLMNAIKTLRLAHAYLFGGPRGIGKTSVARILAKAINCKSGEPGIPCNTCPSCVEITTGSSVDVQEIDGASNRGIDEIRQLRENVKYMPSSSNYRIYIIDEVHMLTLPAFNALLKTLEEPPAHVKFIFATTETHKVPVTILSRCQRFDFKKIPPALIVSHLEKITKEENIKISKSGLAIIARVADGCMRDAQSLLDQVISYAGDKAEDNHVSEILGIIDRDVLQEASRAIIESSPEKCLGIVQKIYDYGYDIKEFYRGLMNQFRNLLFSVLASQDHLLEMGESEKEEAKQQAEKAGLEKLQVILNFLIHREQDLRYTSNPRLILEMTMIRLCRLGDFLSFGDLLEKIGALEKRLLAASTTSEQPKSEHSSDSSTACSHETQEEIKAEGKGFKAEFSAKDKDPQSWDGFLDFLKSKSRPMFNVLKDWELLALTEDTLEISKSNQSFSASFFDETERYNQLLFYCRDFFQKDIKINIVENNRSESIKNSQLRIKESDSDLKRQVDLPRPVQDILIMFDGEIKK